MPDAPHSAAVSQLVRRWRWPAAASPLEFPLPLRRCRRRLRLDRCRQQSQIVAADSSRCRFCCSPRCCGARRCLAAASQPSETSSSVLPKLSWSAGPTVAAPCAATDAGRPTRNVLGLKYRTNEAPTARVRRGPGRLWLRPACAAGGGARPRAASWAIRMRSVQHEAPPRGNKCPGGCHCRPSLPATNCRQPCRQANQVDSQSASEPR